MQLTHDGDIDIAIGRSRHETHWKNKVWKWSDMVDKLAKTHRTVETLEEYLAMSKSLQDERKDVGGYVGGYVAQGRRTKGAVNYRSLVTLDLDFAQAGVWDDFMLLYHNAAVMYSTHKHQPSAPRLRLVLPLDRHVAPDEYVAIARRVAGDIGIELFDETTYQPERLMYWPSSSSNGEYLFEYQDAPFLSADEVLARYRDWRDSSEWPVSQRVGRILERAMKKQGDPLEKPGIVGAWCRTYTIHDVIESHLSEAYVPSDIEGRYTYTKGSTTGGLVTYEDKFAYSHHGTDPASMQLCNAFDLVRLHLYGLRDEDTDANTPINKKPSFLAMEQMALKDMRVKGLMVAERMADAQEDFKDLLGEADPGDNESSPEDDKWMAQLEVSKRAEILNTIPNIRLILQNDPMLKGRFVFDSFRKQERIVRALPWDKGQTYPRGFDKRDFSALRTYIGTKYMFDPTKLEPVLDSEYKDKSYHPVKDYFATLKWDGKPRIDRMLIDYLGAEDNDYTKAVSRKIMVAAVSRIKRPGCKFDYVPVLVGKQGTNKSTLISKLGGEWYSESQDEMKGKGAYETLQGAWIVELAELAAMRNNTVEIIKHFISKTTDRFRVAYGRDVEDFPRECVFIGSTNNFDFLVDKTGNRRFWPIRVGFTAPVFDVHRDLTEEVRAQMWAEALHYYDKREPLYLTPKLEQFANGVQADYTEDDVMAGRIVQYLNKLLPRDWDSKDVMERRHWSDDPLVPSGVVQRTHTCAHEIASEVFGIMDRDLQPVWIRRIRSIMDCLPDWQRDDARRSFKHYGQQRGYKRVSGLIANVQETDVDIIEMLG